jgi:hypothetical protein
MAEETLISRWRKLEPDLLEDGIVEPKSYFAASKKVLFLLKEPNDRGGGYWDMRPWVREGAKARTWNNIARWTQVILSYPVPVKWNALDTIGEHDRRKILRNIAFMNVKKAPGGGVAVRKAILAASERNAALIREQISLTAPDIIIVCGDPLEKAYENIYGRDNCPWIMGPHGCRLIKGEQSPDVISFYHPARGNKKERCEQLADLLTALSNLCER